MSCRLLFMTGLMLALAASAAAEPYWISYEGSDFPENQGWTRTFCDENGIVGQGGAIRSLEDGALVLDSRASTTIVDFYERHQPVDPDPGEMFVMEWRLKVDDVLPHVDPSIALFSDSFRAVGFEFSHNAIHSVFESDATIPFTPDEFHAFELRSTDMQSYELRLDGDVVLLGNFASVFQAGRVGWGDAIQGGRSLAAWDYVRCGVVPEPNLGALIMVILAWHSGRRT